MNLFIMSIEEIDKAVAKEILSLVKRKPNCVLGLATGGTAIGVYHQIIKLKNAEVSFKDVKTFNLDEYVGISPDNTQSYHYFMHTNLFSHLDFQMQNVHIPDGLNYRQTLQEYDNEIEMAGGIDLQLLGIGSNGHIAFNEPGTSFDTLTHLVDLKESTIKDNARFFTSINDVPKQAITMGHASIMKAKKIILIAKGEQKAEAIKKLFKEPMNEQLPASILQSHPNVDVYCDDKAAEYLKKEGE